MSDRLNSLTEERSVITKKIKAKADKIHFRNDNIPDNNIVIISSYNDKTPIIYNNKFVGYTTSIFENNETTVTYFEFIEDVEFAEHYYDFVETLLCTYGSVIIKNKIDTDIVLTAGSSYKLYNNKLHTLSFLKNSGCICVLKPKV